MVLKLHETCSARIYGFLRKSLPVEAAEELTQETFLRLLQHKNLERKSITISYLFRVAQNLLRRRYNVAARGRFIQETIYRQQATQFTKEPLENSRENALESGPLHEALQQLSSEEQTTIRLIVFEGKSYSHAANALKVPISTINNWKHRALKKLRGLIDAADGTSSEYIHSHSTFGSATPQGDCAEQAACEIPSHGKDSLLGSDRTARPAVRPGARAAG
jgi:RNA polymerase sigma factor (sigma-70 family)